MIIGISSKNLFRGSCVFVVLLVLFIMAFSVESARAEEPSLSGFDPSLSGVWDGKHIHNDGQATVQLSMILHVDADICFGGTEEPRTLGNPPAKKLYASVGCEIIKTPEGLQFKFKKTYDGQSGVNYSVIYEGLISPDARSVAGTWRQMTSGASGAFEMNIIGSCQKQM